MQIPTSSQSTPPVFLDSSSSLLMDFVGVLLRSLRRLLISSPPSPPAGILRTAPPTSSPSSSLPLQRRRRRRPRIPATLRSRVWQTHSGGGTSLVGRCFVCGESINFQNFHCGHVVPVSKGGPTSLENIRPLCSLCNGSMGTENLEEFAARYFGSGPRGPRRKECP